ncbi:MAG: NAD(P)/FAD-dependent oxidoreductase, partial [Bacteroidetes bacterium]|nr:NAD(P)/FAD-dependent oxidoreductase [Bacteroidota bacterium]
MEDLSNYHLNIPDTDLPRVVVLGAGFGGINTIKYLPQDKFQVVLFDKRNYHTFQPLLYQVATAGLQPDAIAGPLRNIFSKRKNLYFRMLRVLSVDSESNTLHTVIGPLRYDYLIIANGMKSNFFGNDQIRQYALPLKSIPDALNLRSHLMQQFEWASLTNDPVLREKLMTIVVTGAGPTGVETAGALAELRRHVLPKDYPAIDFSAMKIYLVEGMDRVLPPMSEKAGNNAKKKLEKMCVVILLNTMVANYDGDILTMKNGASINTNTVIWSAGVMGDVLDGIKPEWTEKSRLLTDPHCKVIGTRNIFAIGDVAMMKLEKYPKGHPGVAQPAIQMGRYIGRHLAEMQAGKTVPPFKYFDKGSLATIGRGKAVADLPRHIFLGGRPAWWIWLLIHINYL